MPPWIKCAVTISVSRLWPDCHPRVTREEDPLHYPPVSAGRQLRGLEDWGAHDRRLSDSNRPGAGWWPHKQDGTLSHGCCAMCLVCRSPDWCHLCHMRRWNAFVYMCVCISVPLSWCWCDRIDETAAVWTLLSVPPFVAVCACHKGRRWCVYKLSRHHYVCKKAISWVFFHQKATSVSKEVKLSNSCLIKLIWNRKRHFETT